MGKKAITALAAALLLCAGFLLGRFTAGPAEEGTAAVFHAEILERDGPAFLVNGLGCNDVNHRGGFTFSVKDDTPLLWRGTEITLDDLEAGGRIAVTYSGTVLEIYPAQLPDILRIDLLEDEK